MSQYENLNLAKSLAQSMGLTEYEVVYYAPASDSVLANAPRSAAALEWEEAAKSNSKSSVDKTLTPATNNSDAGVPVKTSE